MNNHTFIHAVLGATLAFTLAACGDNGTGSGGSTGDVSTTNPSGTDTTNPPTTENPTTENPTTENPTATIPPTTDISTSTSTTEGPTTEGPTTSGTTGDNGFMFPDDPYDAYTQIDRHAAVEAGTAGIAAAKGLGLMGEDLTIRNMYNASNPEEDAMGMWVPEITKSVMFFHAALDDDLMSLMLTPATPMEALMQAGPVIVPDTIKYDPSKPTGYPNGRNLEDQVVDITLAAVLLKLGPNQPLDLFASLPLNPPANDVPFSKEWPYLAPPHAP